MAVTRIGNLGNRFIGLSTDTKPTTCQIGATFLEYDTGKLYQTPDSHRKCYSGIATKRCNHNGENRQI